MTRERIRVIDLETAGNGPHEVCEIGWQDVTRDADGSWRLDDERGAHLVDPGRAISADTMAIHHIRDVDVVGAPFWKQIAPSVLRPEGGGVIALAAHRAGFEMRYCTPALSGGARWICTWKCALRIWPHLQRFSNQMLRYQRMPDGLVHEIGLPAQAMPDAYVTAHHLRDMLNAASLDELLRWSGEPGLLPRVPSGPDRGKGWDQVSEVALRVLALDRDVDLRFSAETELKRRGEFPMLEPSTPIQRSLF
ncbi:DNA polymerase III subunit epsilon [Bosea sp. BH3]|uniref:DNA polymerase III subunit epsilon n=1 Tax=Bosea sp. BH3 TaxID=2871701 RepID=UPI0021CB49FF|nr:DNA polymerase III subunit epsilon [Bosea sp. BH3]MCU4180148.1 DNA polymerase III subunit epsilon [Bosea sp. BH3]